MTFEELLDQAIDLLRRRGRVTYRTLKRQFQLDDEVLEDLKKSSYTANVWPWMKTVACWSGQEARARHPSRLPPQLFPTASYPQFLF